MVDKVASLFKCDASISSNVIVLPVSTDVFSKLPGKSLPFEITGVLFPIILRVVPPTVNV